MSRFIALTTLAAIFCASCGENHEEFYPTRDEALKSGSVDRGWLPDWLPEDSYNISEAHNIDTNARAFKFTVRGGFSAPLYCSAPAKVEEPIVQKIQFPKNIHRQKGVVDCAGIYVLVVDKNVYGWSNG